MIVLLWYFLLYAPLERRPELGAGADRARSRRRPTGSQADLARLQAQAKNSTQQAALLRKLDAAVPEQPDLAEFIIQANDIADQSGISFLSIAPSPPAARDRGRASSTSRSRSTAASSSSRTTSGCSRSSSASSSSTASRSRRAPTPAAPAAPTDLHGVVERDVARGDADRPDVHPGRTDDGRRLDAGTHDAGRDHAHDAPGGPTSSTTAPATGSTTGGT